MRYIGIEDIEFTDINGNTVVVKDMREYSDYNLMAIIKINENDMLDEIACRDEVYGEGNESMSYAIFEMNREKITENDFSLSKIKSLMIPMQDF